MSSPLKIVVADPSPVIRVGVETLIKRIPGNKYQLIELTSCDLLIESLRMHKPDLLLINPIIPGSFMLSRIKEESGCNTLKCIALVSGLTDNNLLKQYDEQFSLYNSQEELKEKIEKLYKKETRSEEEGDEQQTLSAREKEIIVGVVKGLTNREIADTLYLSTHTVITHRRNIARKLQIHSPSGLTVYAIVNKLVELKDIQQGNNG